MRASSLGILGFAVGAVLLCGCERLLGVDFSDIPSESTTATDAGRQDATADTGASADAGADAEAEAGEVAPVWSFRGGPAHQGRSRFSVKQPMQMLWTYSVPGSSGCSDEPLIDGQGNTIVVESINGQLQLTALDATGVGHSIWTGLGPLNGVVTYPAFGPAGDFFLSAPGLSRVGKDAAAGWGVSLGASSPPVIDTTHQLVLLQGTESLGAFKEETGETAWTIDGYDPYSNYGVHAPALTDGGVVVAIDGGIMALDPAGNTLWNIDLMLPRQVTLLSPIVGDDGTIFVLDANQQASIPHTLAIAESPDGGLPVKGSLLADSCADFPALGTDGSLIVACSAAVYAFDPATLAQRWAYPLPPHVLVTPYSTVQRPTIDADGTILVLDGLPDDAGVDSTGLLIALSPMGELKWQFPLPVTGAGVSIGADGTVHLCMSNGSVEVLGPP